ncbi:MAG: hypothetical protein GH158_06900 [Dehalococcoidia bacterium]|nr:hypothetical protein [Dehalococcoidia bacterium]
MGAFKETSRLPEFEKDTKRLLKRFKTIDDDLEIFIEKQLFLYHKLKKDNRGIFQITGLPVGGPKVYKATKFACKSLKGSGVQSGIRIIYAYDEEKDKIVLIEMYFKGDKANEDKQRIFEYLNLR